MDDLIGTVADMVIEEYNTVHYSNGELIEVPLLKYSVYVSKLHHCLNAKGYENVIHNVDGHIEVEIKTGKIEVEIKTGKCDMKKVKLINNYGTWTIGKKKKPLSSVAWKNGKSGVKIEQDGESGILRLSHQVTENLHSEWDYWVIVTEDYRLVPLQEGEALIGES